MREYGPGLFSWAALEPFAKDIDWHARIVEAMTQDGQESSLQGWLSLDKHMPESVATDVGRSVLSTVLKASFVINKKSDFASFLIDMVETMDRVYPSGLPDPIREGWDTYVAESLEHLGRFQIVGLLYQVREPREEGGRESLRMVLQKIEPALLARRSFRALWEKEDFVAIHTMLPWGKFRLDEEQVKHWFPAVHAALSPMLFEHEWGNTELLQKMARTVMNPVQDEPAISLPALHL